MYDYYIIYNYKYGHTDRTIMDHIIPLLIVVYSSIH
jgi:hypothetical protein